MTPERCIISVEKPLEDHREGVIDILPINPGGPIVSFSYSDRGIGRPDPFGQCVATELFTKANMKNPKLPSTQPAVCGRCSRLITQKLIQSPGAT